MREPFPGIELWIRGGDLCFVIGTLFDIVLSYHLLSSENDLYTVKGAKLAVFGAFMWLAAAIVYVATTIYMRRNLGPEEVHDDVQDEHIYKDEQMLHVEHDEYHEDLGRVDVLSNYDG